MMLLEETSPGSCASLSLHTFWKADCHWSKDHFTACVGPPLIGQFWEGQEGQLQEASCFLVGVAGLNFYPLEYLKGYWKTCWKNNGLLLSMYQCVSWEWKSNYLVQRLGFKWDIYCGYRRLPIQPFFLVFANGANCSF